MAQESWNCDTAEGSGCQQQEGLVLCSNNCGVFGCAATMNLCSKCYRELTLKKKGSPAEISIISSTSGASSSSHLSPAGLEKTHAKSPLSLPLPASEPVKAHIALPSSMMAEILTDLKESSSCPPISQSHLSKKCASVASSLLPHTSHGKDSSRSPRRQSTNKCLTCKKRMGLLGFKCRCGNIFCASHRYSDKHGCPFDYKSAGREAIAKANPIVVAPKVDAKGKVCKAFDDQSCYRIRMKGFVSGVDLHACNTSLNCRKCFCGGRQDSHVVDDKPGSA